MNTQLLKTFAQKTRLRLLEAVRDKLNYVLHTDSADLRDYAASIRTLKEEIQRTSEEAVIDRVAYTWFNRLMALRFMDANDYQPLRVRILSPQPGNLQAEILSEALQGNIPEELKIDRQRINDLLDGNIESPNPQNEVYRMLLIASCNHLHTLFPFLFEKIFDYTELLLPDDLISELSIVHDFVEGMTEGDCSETEMIGWLYQFYISDKKDEVFAAKGKVKKEEIPAATQLFTPRWIVEYMVQNTVGKLWIQNNPDSALKDKMPYYIETESSKSADYLKISSPEEITLLDQACGSGHILVYGFELLYQIYEEAGYTASQIPTLIIEKNLYGYEIDERAAQLASFSILMKARSHYRRLFRVTLQPNILCYRDLNLSDDEIKAVFKELNLVLSEDLLFDLQCMQQATNYGSLIQPRSSFDEIEEIKQSLSEKKQINDIFIKHQISELYSALEQLEQLSKKVCCIVDNPPYMGGGNMNKELSGFVRTKYPESKADLMACFMEGGLASLKSNGLLGMINQHSWMFLSSYEKLREKLIDSTQFDTLLHLGPRTFPEIGGEVVQNAAFTFINYPPKKQSSYIRLVDYKDSHLKSEKTLEAIQNRDCGWFYIKNQKDFEKIPGLSVAYWLSLSEVGFYDDNNLLGSYSHPAKGIDTGENDFFLRFWSEVSFKKKQKDKWVPYNKGGEFRKWYGNKDYVLRWFKGVYLEERKSWRKKKPTLRNKDKWFQKSFTWTTVSSGGFSARLSDDNALFDNGGCSLFSSDYEFLLLGGLINSIVASRYLEFLSPTLNFQPGGTAKIPVVNSMFGSQFVQSIENVVLDLIKICKQEWNSRETSWDFEQNELIRLQAQDIEESIDLYKQYWTKKFIKLHQNEEELNARFIEIYGLQEELTSDVPLEDITILRDELDQKKLKKLSQSYKSGWTLNNEKWELLQQADYPELPFDEKELVHQFISYGVACMFGRYSLDKPGLILANQGETIQDYLDKVGKNEDELRFKPDKSNIVPVLDSEWFGDDIGTQFRAFVKAVWGERDLQRNMDYIEKTLGKSIRNYFYRDFYTDHVKRYKKRPIYWMYVSPDGSFQTLIYMHRYTPDTMSHILNDYLRPYIDKLENRVEHLNHLMTEGTDREKNQATKEMGKVEKIILDLRKYDREVFYPMAMDRIAIDLDDGVLVNYNKFGPTLKIITGLSDKKAKDKVRKFDWIDTSEIR